LDGGSLKSGSNKPARAASALRRPVDTSVVWCAICGLPALPWWCCSRCKCAFAKLHLRRAKTDRIDAGLIAACTHMLAPNDRVPPDARLEPLADHLTYIEQIEEDIARLRTRLEHADNKRLREMMEADIASLSKRRLAALKLLRVALCAHDVRGIGMRTALTIVIRMPELGQVSREEAAALAGLAPFSRQSGKRQGPGAYRRRPAAVAPRAVRRSVGGVGAGGVPALEPGVAGAVSAPDRARQKPHQRGGGVRAQAADSTPTP
jgi:hypothetical protein